MDCSLQPTNVRWQDKEDGCMKHLPSALFRLNKEPLFCRPPFYQLETENATKDAINTTAECLQAAKPTLGNPQ